MEKCIIVVKDFFKINLNKESCDLSFFDNSSFVFYENFKFGSNKFKQDVSKYVP